MTTVDTHADNERPEGEETYGEHPCREYAYGEQARRENISCIIHYLILKLSQRLSSYFQRCHSSLKRNMRLEHLILVPSVRCSPRPIMTAFNLIYKIHFFRVFFKLV